MVAEEWGLHSPCSSRLMFLGTMGAQHKKTVLLRLSWQRAFASGH